jgi:oligopeptidase B
MPTTPERSTVAEREQDEVFCTPPAAKRLARVAVRFDDRFIDEYAWLREKDDPGVRTYLEAENRYAEAVMKPTEELQKALYEEMLGRIKQTDISVPYRDGAYWHYSRTEEGRQYPIYCRKMGSLDAPEFVTLDLNELARNKPYLALGAFEFSDDGRYLAYSLDETGFREYTLRIKDVETGQTLSERIERCGSVAWASDNRTLLYTIEDLAKRPYRLCRRRLGESGLDVLFEENDEAFQLEVERSRSRDVIFIVSASHTTSETRFVPAAAPEEPLRLVAPRVHGQEYEVEHAGDRFLIRANDAGRNFRLVSTPLDAPGREHWSEIVPEDPEVFLAGLDVFDTFTVLHERKAGLPRLRVFERDATALHTIEFPDAVYSVSPAPNRQFDARTFRYQYESLQTPSSVYDYDVALRVSTLLKRTEVLGGFDPDRYGSERIEATASDGTRVPISLVYRKGLRRDGSAALWLNGYGAYGFPLPIGFSPNRLSLLDRGIVCAFAHVRGGGEMGKRWHDDGRMMNKRNTFTDFIACAEELIGRGYTSADRLVAEGASAGGLLIGAVVNMRPDLFRAVVTKVPFVDLLNTMSDRLLPLTVGEYEEWGDPARRDQYDVMKSYCPYTNLDSRSYPAMLVKTSFNDSQVMYWEPAKYVARLRRLKTDSRTLILKTNMAAGHGGASGRYDSLAETSFDYAFILSQLGGEK